ncbi:nuclear transport factor 2 family protein [Flagellimonas sp. W118]|uniref:nuclear transport factor 2 family protein n=1 Tax=Flagellimonas sp. W118 TaxID=3410791 RepID=UPI003BF53EF5
MKNLMLLLFVLTVSASCNQQEPELVQPSVINNEDQKILRNLKEVQWPKAYREQDTVLLDRILGNDFQMIDAGGTWSNKAKELEWIKENAMENDSFFYEIKRLDILPNGTALICGTGHIFNDSTETIYQSSNILIKRKDAWKAVASHVSGIKTLD